MTRAARFVRILDSTGPDGPRGGVRQPGRVPSWRRRRPPPRPKAPARPGDHDRDGRRRTGPAGSASGRRARPSDQQPSDVPAPQTSPNPWAKVLGPIKMSTTVDTYYAYNGNQPASGKNVLRNFDEKRRRVLLQLLRDGLRSGADGEAPGRFPGRHRLRADRDLGQLGRPRRWRAEVPAAGVRQRAGAGRRGTADRRRQVQHPDWRRADRDRLQLELLPFPALCLGGARTTTSACAPRCPSPTRSPSPGILVNGWNNAKDNNNGKTGAAQVAWKVLPSLTI